MLIIAHRGNHDDMVAPENTLEAFARAWECGADGVELDVHLTADGRIVVVHDPHTGRLGDVRRIVRRSTHRDLTGVIIRGPGGHGRRRTGRVPLLDEVLAAVPPGGRVFVEIKCGAQILKPLAHELRVCGLARRQVTVIGFTDRPMAAARRALPNHELLLLYGKMRLAIPSLQSVIKEARRIGADGVDMRAHRDVDASYIARVKEHGLGMHCWLTEKHERDERTVRRLAGGGVDSITTDRPRWVRGITG